MNKQQTIMVVIGIIISFIMMAGGAVFGHYDYDFENDKCSNMKSSPYEFNIDAQINAEYSSSCYFYQHHKFAYGLNLILGAIMGLLLSALFWLLVGILNSTIFDDYF